MKTLSPGAALAGFVLLSAPAALAQQAPHDHAHAQEHTPAPTAPEIDHSAHQHHEHHDAPPAQEHTGHAHAAHQNAMAGALGPYAATREASGTSWQPDSARHDGVHAQAGDWMLMGHATLTGLYDRQGGPRGANRLFVAGMAMGMAQRPLGDAGTLGLRAMVSPDPLMGKRGYPLLLATGETADGRDHLVDRQHPHDLFMELSASYSHRLSERSSVFLYAGLPGEPAIGPSAFMHRPSAVDNPEAPIAHHWLDSTHITFGVITAGLVVDRWKAEVSAFKGREPDQHRYNIETPKLDSVAGRLTWNPTANWSLQASYARLNSPEQLEPDIDEKRVTASATYNRPFGPHNWATTFAWGRKMVRPGHTLDAFLLESDMTLGGAHTIFARAERTTQDELVHDIVHGVGPQAVNKFSLGYVRDFKLAEHWTLGAGGLVSQYTLPRVLKPAYGGNPTSFMLFVRAKLG